MNERDPRRGMWALFVRMVAAMPRTPEPPVRDHRFIGDMWIDTSEVLHVWTGTKWATNDDSFNIQVEDNTA